MDFWLHPEWHRGGREQFKCLGSEERIQQGMGIAVSRQSPENALKTPRQTGLLKNSITPAQSQILLFLWLCFFWGQEPCFSRCSPNKCSVDKEDYLLVSVKTCLITHSWVIFLLGEPVRTKKNSWNMFSGSLLPEIKLSFSFYGAATISELSCVLSNHFKVTDTEKIN